MTTKPNIKPANLEQTPVLQDSVDSEVLKIAARRRLLKKVAVVGVPVITTLASRPVLAWHCRTPSMWGSMVMNVNTSLRTNAGHETGYRDETWTIKNWGRNTTRSNLARPWGVIKGQGADFSVGAYEYARSSSTPSHSYYLDLGSQINKRYLDLKKLKVVDLCAATGVNSSSVGGAELVYDFFNNKWNTFEAHIIVAQLNYKYLGATANLDDCLGTKDSKNRFDLAAIASAGTATVNGVTWDKERIIDFLQNNWIVVPYDGYVSWSTGSVNGDIGYKSGQVASGKALGQDYHYFSFPIEK